MKIMACSKKIYNFIFYQELSVSKNFIYPFFIKKNFNHVHGEIKILVSRVFQTTLHCL